MAVDQDLLDQIAGTVADLYREVEASLVTVIADELKAARQRLMDRGIVSFTDRADRTWRLSSYAEMIGRTNAARAAIQGQMDQLASAGIDLVYVSDNTQECKRCRPFESKVLRRGSGPIGRIQVEHGTRDGELVTVDVLDTLDGAQSKGFQHPNCRHSVPASSRPQAGPRAAPSATCSRPWPNACSSWGSCPGDAGTRRRQPRLPRIQRFQRQAHRRCSLRL
ncbi:Phage minor capsid protein 2 [Streptosporangium canum]|uniref:Phage minor capsid protein 2 n=1 Tax=Streptosporangium canum TaxID=324952 RepID=A0A1I3XT91_9ACTN|nr:phage minor capsid protein [Streptosporangium canum]SFK22765.1 Phage minor capsid protein 2 [Streptosporangium canum]